MFRLSKCLMYFHKQAGSGFESGSEIKVKVGSGSENNNFGSTTLPNISSYVPTCDVWLLPDTFPTPRHVSGLGPEMLDCFLNCAIAS
jgi:hypothetical protein